MGDCIDEEIGVIGRKGMVEEQGDGRGEREWKMRKGMDKGNENG